MSAPGSSAEDPLSVVPLVGTHAWNWCRCTKCGFIALCTPAFDYYTVTLVAGLPKPGTPLICETCFQASHGLRTVGQQKM